MRSSVNNCPRCGANAYREIGSTQRFDYDEDLRCTATHDNIVMSCKNCGHMEFVAPPKVEMVN